MNGNRTRVIVGVIAAMVATLALSAPAQADSTGTFSPSWGTAKVTFFEGGENWFHVEAWADSAGSATTYLEVKVVVPWGLDWKTKVVKRSGSYTATNMYHYGFDNGAYALVKYCKDVFGVDPCTGVVALNLHDH